MVTNDRKGIIPALVDEKGFYFVDRSGTLVFCIFGDNQVIYSR